MHRTARLAATTAPIALLLALSACAAGAPEPTEPADDPPAADGNDTGCLTSQIWALDVADAAAQLGEQIASGGITVISTEGQGRHTMTFTDDGLASSSVDLSYIVTTESEGLTIAVVQTHAGESSGEWFWTDGEIIGFDAWDNSGYTIQTTTIINGVESPTSTDMPTETLAGSDMKVIGCSAESLTTQVEGSPFTQNWGPAS